METNHNFLQTGGQPVSDRMRELLARAAQDHVYESRSQGQVLDEIRQRLEGMEWLLREVRERELTSLTGQLDGVRGQVEELTGKAPGWAEGLGEHLEAVGERIKPVSELPALWADVGVVAENVDESLTRLQNVMDSAAHIADATAAASQRMEEMTKRLDKLQGAMEAASVRFNRLDKSLAELGHRSEKLEHTVTGITGRVEQSLSDMADRIDQGLDSVGSRVEGLGGRLEGIDGRLEGLSGKINGFDSRFDALGERLSQLPAALEINEIHRRLAELAQRPHLDYGERFDELERQVSTVTDPLIVELRSRPDRGEIEDTVSKIVESAYSGLSKRLDETGREVQDDVKRRLEGAQDDVSRKFENVREDISKRFEDIHLDVAKRVEGVFDEVVKRSDAVHEEVTKRTDAVHEQVAKRSETMQTEISKRVEGVQTEVGNRVGAVHEDVLKRLATLEETMLALAEALLRPRRDGKE
ncbi:hypothetical protein EDD29_7931 [Actinocorallia herbida]|uniref:Apolipoprotein A1/A4/E domain-containing protein n=2 Tax=Actinocorallia herbida TaxID=58109 RepID=A0A3N1D9K1_9ACTN|nr:hypothetical protein EDD29_7931 [Actinocorallia herbida]